MAKLEIKERKMLRKIMGTKFQNNNYDFYSNEALYVKSEILSDTTGKSRIDFYGHIFRMNPDRLTRQIFDFKEIKNFEEDHGYQILIHCRFYDITVISTN